MKYPKRRNYNNCKRLIENSSNHEEKNNNVHHLDASCRSKQSDSKVKTVNELCVLSIELALYLSERGVKPPHK